MNPLVSILIPAYHLKFFENALKSAVAQDYPNLEIVICDDSAGDGIAQVCKRFADGRVIYIKNSKNLGFSANFTKCFRQGRGEYLKFLNDDDELHPTCVSRMVNEFNIYGSKVSIVTSRRHIINERGDICPDVSVTKPLACITSYMDGQDLGNFVLKYSGNFIGEPTTVMFRKRDVEIADDNLFMLNGIDYVCFADLSLWLRLLSRGGAVYIADALSRFRFHSAQEQRKASNHLKMYSERFYIIAAAEKLGFLQTPELYNQAMQSLAQFFHSRLSDKRIDAVERKELEELWHKIPSRFYPHEIPILR